MSEKEKLLDLTERLVKYGLSKGAESVEIYAVNEKKTQIEHKGENLTSSSNISAGLGVRVAIGKRWSFTSSSSLNETAVQHEIEQAIKIARVMGEDKDFNGFPEGKPPANVKNLTSESLINIQIEEIMEALIDARNKGLDFNENLSNVQGSFTLLSGTRAIANSNGLNYAYSKTTYSAGFSAVGSYGGHRFSENSFTGGTKFNNDFDELALDAAKRTAEMFGATGTVEGDNLDVLMEPFASAIFFIAVTRLVFKGNLALSHRSMFQLKDINQEVASQQLTFIDDGTLEGGIKSAPIDDEGNPSKRTPLIEKGILKNFLFDYSQAINAGVEPTGNSLRGIGHSSRSYTALPTISSRNRIILPGTKSQEQLISEIDHGILIGYPAGIFLSNPMTTDFTIFPTRVLEIKKGEIIGPRLGTSIAGNGLQWLKKISAIGKDSKMMESMITPSVVFNSITVTSSKKVSKKRPTMMPQMK